jgi:hypothetical protein
MSTHFTHVRAYALAVAATVAVIGCTPVDGTGTGSGSSGATPTDGGDAGSVTAAGQACLDLADAFASATQRCGGDYDAARKELISDLANGDCNSVTVRNETELRSGCLPSFSTISCADLQQQRFVPECAEQIVRDK